VPTEKTCVDVWLFVSDQVMQLVTREFLAHVSNIIKKITLAPHYRLLLLQKAE